MRDGKHRGATNSRGGGKEQKLALDARGSNCACCRRRLQQRRAATAIEPVERRGRAVHVAEQVVAMALELKLLAAVERRCRRRWRRGGGEGLECRLREKDARPSAAAAAQGWRRRDGDRGWGDKGVGSVLLLLARRRRRRGRRGAHGSRGSSGDFPSGLSQPQDPLYVLQLVVEAVAVVDVLLPLLLVVQRLLRVLLDLLQVVRGRCQRQNLLMLLLPRPRARLSECRDGIDGCGRCGGCRGVAPAH